MHPELLALMIPIIAIVGGLATVPLGMHYDLKKRAANRLSAQESETLADLSRVARKLESRIVTLEKILDAEVPGWRVHHD